MNLAESRNTFHKVWKAAHKDIVAYSAIDTRATDKEKPWIRRGRYRASFAFVEAVTFGTKRLILEGHEAKLFGLSAVEQMILLERDYELKDSGQIRELRRYPSFKSNFRFTFDLFNKVYATGFQVPYGDAGWQALQDALEVRDRIAHPKLAEDFDISDSEMKVLKRADAWFWKLYQRIFMVLNRPEFFQPKRRQGHNEH
jgi:hypothetical protein